MYVCICNAITDKQIRQAAKAGVRDVWALQRELGVGTGCGTCKDTARSILRESTRSERPSGPRIYRPALA